MGWEHRPQSEVQMGNGTLLVTLGASGEVDQLFAPNIDALQSRLGSFRTTLVIPGPDGGNPELIPVSSDQFDCTLQLEHGSQVLRADYRHRHRGLRIHRRIGLHPTEPLLLDQWRIEDAPAGLLHESIPWIGGSTSAHCSLYHPTFNGLVHHRGRRWLGIMVRGDTQWVRVGHLSETDRYRMWSGETVYPPRDAHDLAGFPGGQVRLGWDQVAQGPATYGAIAAGPAKALEFAIICADSEAHLGKLLEMLRHMPSQRFFQIIEAMSRKRLAPAEPWLRRIENASVRALCERSIDVLHSLQDASSGALMAAAEVDPHSRLSGGYGYCWPRDGGYLASALGAFGFHDRVEHYLHFTAETQDVSGAWWQRYLATGHAGPSWGRIQIDEPASVIVAACQHYRRTHDLLWLESFWPTIERGLAFLESFHSAEHPMGQPSHDLWEERMGIHAYSLGAVSSAFLAGAYLARELSDREAQRRHHQWAHRIRNILIERFLPREGAAKRSFIVHDGQRVHDGYWDERVDSSLLGLIHPFAVLDRKNPVSQRIIHGVRNRLWSHPQGGVHRYEEDVYRGGNPWVLTTLWLASVELAAGDISGAKECFQWVISKATPLGMLAEQIHRESGRPFWVIPLGWSHAMFLSFVREVLDRGLEAELWERL